MGVTPPRGRLGRVAHRKRVGATGAHFHQLAEKRSARAKPQQEGRRQWGSPPNSAGSAPGGPGRRQLLRLTYLCLKERSRRARPPPALAPRLSTPGRAPPAGAAAAKLSAGGPPRGRRSSGAPRAVPSVTWRSSGGISSRSPGISSRSPGISSRSPDVSSRSPDVSSRSPDVSSRSPGVSSRSPGVSSRSPGVPGAVPNGACPRAVRGVASRSPGVAWRSSGRSLAQSGRPWRGSGRRWRSCERRLAHAWAPSGSPAASPRPEATGLMGAFRRCNLGPRRPGGPALGEVLSADLSSAPSGGRARCRG